MTNLPQPGELPGRGDVFDSDRSQVIDGVDVDALAAAVISCPSVSGLLAGPLGAATTLLPGRRVAGVRVSRDEVRVEVRSRWGSTAGMLAREVVAATEPLLAGHRLAIVIGDIDDPGSVSGIDALPSADETAALAPMSAWPASEAVSKPPPLRRRSQSPSQGELS